MNTPVEVETKIHQIRTVINDLLARPVPMGVERHLGLRVFGTQQPAAANTCDDTVQLLPIGPIDSPTVRERLAGITPQGTAPIAHAMERAAEDFPEHPDTDNVLLLIADGGDSCNGDPCAAAERLHAGPRRIITHVIGFDLDQKAQDQLRCAAAKGDGQFFLARNAMELYTALDQAVHANLPYNLRVDVLAGSVPLPVQYMVRRVGTDQLVDQGRTPGVKFFQLPAGSYDITIEYLESVLAAKPLKVLKGVEVQTTSKAKQVVTFDLGQLTLGAVDPDGRPAIAAFEIRKAGETAPIAGFQAGPEPKTVFLAPGKYDIAVAGLAAGDIPLAAGVNNIEVGTGAGQEQIFRFETGRLVLRAQIGPERFVAGRFQVARKEDPATIVTEGAVAAEGSTITLPTGAYTISLTPTDESLQGLGPYRLDGVEILARETVQHLVTFPSGTLVLSGKDMGKDGQQTPAKTEFHLRKPGTTDPVAKLTSVGPPVTAFVAPGAYDVVALNIGANITPPPSTLWANLEVPENGTVTREAVFQLGELKLAGKNARSERIPVVFTVYRAGSEEALGALRAETDWATFRLTPGLYSVRAEEGTAKGENKPTVWFHNVAVTGNGVTSREATFTFGRIKLGCRGENNAMLPCEFRIFAYGTDRPLISGTTGDQWQEFEIDPGGYYMEAGFHDPAGEQLLKKWINIQIAENQTLEQVIRF
ncbi:MAG: hypothetical protein HY543_03465, partial [Deltaproteobacteria bacterium]|nr:hypothetical protein [Deltaproteobacteria bacterium]